MHQQELTINTRQYQQSTTVLETDLNFEMETLSSAAINANVSGRLYSTDDIDCLEYEYTGEHRIQHQVVHGTRRVGRERDIQPAGADATAGRHTEITAATGTNSAQVTEGNFTSLQKLLGRGTSIALRL